MIKSKGGLEGKQKDPKGSQRLNINQFCFCTRGCKLDNNQSVQQKVVVFGIRGNE